MEQYQLIENEYRTVLSLGEDRWKYLLLESQDPEAPAAFQSVYSILITDNGDGIEEASFFYDITRGLEPAIRFIRMLAKNEVPPCAVGDVLADSIGVTLL